MRQVYAIRWADALKAIRKGEGTILNESGYGLFVDSQGARRFVVDGPEAKPVPYGRVGRIAEFCRERWGSRRGMRPV